MLDKKQEDSVRVDFASVREGVWFRWLMEVATAKRDAALQGVVDSEDWENMLRHKTELKTMREMINLLSKFDLRDSSQ